jgi:hypothetical protein
LEEVKGVAFGDDWLLELTINLRELLVEGLEACLQRMGQGLEELLPYFVKLELFTDDLDLYSSFQSNKVNNQSK